MVYDRRHTYEIKEYGGLATPMPVYATLFLLITLSSIGLPLMNGFVGEFLILSGAFQAKAIYGILAASGVIWSAFYMLWLYQRTFYGTITNPVNATLPDADLRERSILWPLAVAGSRHGSLPQPLDELHRRFGRGNPGQQRPPRPLPLHFKSRSTRCSNSHANSRRLHPHSS